MAFGLIQERLRVLTATEDFDLRAYYAGRVNMRDPTLAAQYGQALAFVQRNQPAEAIPILQPLVVANQGTIMLHSLLAQAQIAAGKVQEGLATFARAEALFPRNIPLTYVTARRLSQPISLAKRMRCCWTCSTTPCRRPLRCA